MINTLSYSVEVVQSNVDNWKDAEIIGILEVHENKECVQQRIEVLRSIHFGPQDHLSLETSSNKRVNEKEYEGLVLNGGQISGWDLENIDIISKQILLPFKAVKIEICNLKKADRGQNRDPYINSIRRLQACEKSLLGSAAKTHQEIDRILQKGKIEELQNLASYYTKIGQTWCDQYIFQKNAQLFPKRQQALINKIDEINARKKVFCAGIWHGDVSESPYTKEVEKLIRALSKHKYSLIKVNRIKKEQTSY